MNEETSLSFKPIEIFPHRSEPFSKQKNDSIYLFEEMEAYSFNAFGKFGVPNIPYILHLNNCTLYPQGFAGRTEEDSGTPLPRPWKKRPGRLIVSENNEFFHDSFFEAFLATPKIEFNVSRQWFAKLNTPTEVVDGDCVLLERATKHFGHMLLETPSRHWPDVIEGLKDEYRKMQFVAVSTHSLNASYEHWPRYLKDFLNALEVNFEDIKIVSKPAIIRSLFIPSRITVHAHQGVNHLYFDVMRRASANLAKNAQCEKGLPKKVYLTRSGSNVSNRSVQNEYLIENEFLSRGFEIIRPEELSLEQQAILINEATEIAGISGSQLHLSMFRSHPGLKVFRIAPDWHNPPWDQRAEKFTMAKVTTSIIKTEMMSSEKPQTWSLSNTHLSNLSKDIDEWLAGPAIN